ncbi:uncharacterized protein TNCV_12131 [Trichonephila clavipes]|nr:uncharacterized protein TNCV_12131 [Trichonephila clavipes]
MELERENFLLCYRSSCLVEQFHSDASLEAVDRRAPINSKNWSWMTEGDNNARRSTPAPHGGFPSQQIIVVCVCIGFMSIEPGRLIGTKLPFQFNQSSINGNIMVPFMLDAMPVNAALQSVLTNNIVA